MEVSGHLYASPTIFPGKEPLVPIGYEAGSAPEPTWMGWQRKKSHHCPCHDLKSSQNLNTWEYQ